MRATWLNPASRPTLARGMFAPVTICFLGTLALAPSVHAQDAGKTPAAESGTQVVVCDLPALPLPFAQAEDGRFPAIWPRPDAPEEAGQPAYDLRVTALAVLAMLADGSTLRSGPHKVPLRTAVVWLRAQLDERGRLALSTAPHWILDHAIGTYALCEAARQSRYRTLRPSVGIAIKSLVEHLRHLRRDVDPELLLWTRMIARAAVVFARDLRDEARTSPQPRPDFDAAGLEAEVARLVTRAIPGDARQRAARYLLEDLAGEAADVDLRAELATPFAADRWPDDTVDPLTMLYAYAALYRSGGEPWQKVTRRLTERLVKTQRSGGTVPSTWDPDGEFGAQHGRNGATAVHSLVLMLYYRYCALDLVRV